jgi:hypothetical protein
MTMRIRLFLDHLNQLLSEGQSRRGPRRSSRRLSLETLEARTLLSAQLQLNGDQTLVPFANVNASHNPTTVESEMAVSINPTNPLNVVGFTHDGGNLDHIQVFYSMDGGNTWGRTWIQETGTVNNDGNGVGYRFDPTLKFDANGNLFVGYGYHNTSTNNTTVMVGKSTDGGATFPNSSFRRIQSAGTGYPSEDKWYLTTGPAGPGTTNQAVYIGWDRTATGDTVFLSGSNDGGDTFTTPVQIAPSGGNIYTGPAVGPNGELYVDWLNLNGINPTINVRVASEGLWGADGFGLPVVAAHLHSSLPFLPPAQPRRGISNCPSISVDRSGGPFNGRAYIAYVDQVSGNNTDIYLVWSDDGGATWSSVSGPGNVENEPGTDFNSWVDVDPASGSVNVIYYTTDGDPANRDVLTRVASSFDGGHTFTRVDLASQRSRASAASYAGDFLDYIGLEVRDGTIQGFWSDNRGATPGTFSTDLDAYSARAGFQSATGNNNLIVNVDDPSIDNTIVLRASAVNPDYLEVVLNGQVQYAGLQVSVNNVLITGGLGNDTIVLQDLLPGIGVTVTGGGGNTTLVGPSGPNTWNITGSDAGTLDDTVKFSGVQNLTGGGGFGDTFLFADGQGVDGMIDGSTGFATLDYTAYTSNVYVNLQTGQATGTGGIANIVNVTGGNGPGYNILVGNGGNILNGNNARSLLIGGYFPSVLLGGGDDNILIGGTTDWDTNLTALTAIMAEWTQTSVSYADRVDHLLNGGGLADPYLLNGSSVHGNGGGNTLTGGTGLSLYFGDPNNDVTDWDPSTETFVSV